MKFRIIKIGKIKYPELEGYAFSFVKKLQSDLALDLDIRKDDALTDEDSVKLLKTFDQYDFVMALDERGKVSSSVEFSRKIYDRIDQPQWKRINFVIGGPYGLPKSMMDRANEKIGLSQLTFTSDLAFAILAEQLYRAVQIKKGTGYHHD